MEKRRQNKIIDTDFYQAPGTSVWQGRMDGSQPQHLRWHQQIRLWDLTSDHIEGPGQGDIVLLGFACDEGVRRNQGRVGAKEGPEAIRKALCNTPIHQSELKIWDAGNIICTQLIDQERSLNLEEAQKQLGYAVNKILSSGGFPIVLGGGHEVTYGHFTGIRSYLDEQHNMQAPVLGLINFDAHFDNRVLIAHTEHAGATSGTGFFQIEQDLLRDGQTFNYLAIGIQRIANTPALFHRANTTGSKYILAEELGSPQSIAISNSRIEEFIRHSDHLYLTLDLDVFASAYAPAVSAPTALGLIPDHGFFTCLDTVIQSGKLASLDIAELNPLLDLDQRTAKLAAALLFRIIEKLSKKP